MWFHTSYNERKKAVCEMGFDQKTASWFAYIISIISAIIILATEKDNRTVRLHAWQSLFLGCVWVAVWIVFGILMFIPFLWVLFSIILWLLGVGFLIVTVICIIKAVQGDIFKIPVIYNWAEKMK